MNCGTNEGDEKTKAVRYNEVRETENEVRGYKLYCRQSVYE